MKAFAGWALGCAILFAATHLHAERAVTVYSENDKYFAGTDRHYTNGFKLSFTATEHHAALEAFGHKLDAFGRLLAGLWPGSVEPEATAQAKLSFSIGQNIYTPTQIQTPAPDPTNRPYAAWLYGGVAFQRQEADQLQVIECELGVVGPAALGRQIQNGWHDIIGVAHAQGWSHQLHNEPGVNLTYDWRHRWLHSQESTSTRSHGFDLDVIPRWGASLGNVHTYLDAGAMVRAGWRLPADFGPDLIRSASGGSVKTSGLSCFLFGTASGRAVARDIFLDGNTFESSPSVRKRPLVADFSAGLAVYLGDFHVAYTQNYRTREFYGQPQRDVFGSINLSVVW